SNPLAVERCDTTGKFIDVCVEFRVGQGAVDPTVTLGARCVEILASEPQIRREWADGELHADLVSAPLNARVERRPTGEARREPQASEARLQPSARTRGWASSFTNMDSWPRHARAFSTSVAICTNSTLGRTP